MHACPRCTDRTFETLQGWKMHMSKTHLGYSSDELAAAAQVGTPPAPDARARMDEFAESTMGPEKPSVASDAGVPPADQATPQAGQVPPLPPPGKRVKATPKQLKKLIATIPAKIFEANNIKLDDEDMESIEEATEFIGEVFGVEFQIPAEKYVVQSRIWAFAWVVGVLLLVLVKHRFAALFIKKQQEEDKE